MTTISGATVSSVQLVKSAVFASTSSDMPSSKVNRTSAVPGAQTSSAESSPDMTSSAAALALATAAAASSGSYDFSTVADNARTVLNAGVQKLGKAIDIRTTGAQVDQVFGNMDRRSLFAVATNEGGQFTDIEQQAAGSIMQSQLSQSSVNAPTSSDRHATRFKGMITVLQSASGEEKQSLGWAMQMAAAQTSYNIVAGESGQPPAETGTYTNPLVKALMAAMKSAQGDPSTNRSVGPTNTLAEVLGQPWAKGFQTQIQEAYGATARQGGLLNISA